MSRSDSHLPPEANPELRRPARRPETPGRFVLDSVKMGWRWLRRMKTALYILAAVGVYTLIATLVPQRPIIPDPTLVDRWRSGEEGPGRAVSFLIDLVGGYDVYGSPGFLALLLLLFVSLTACLIPRYRAWWRLVRRSRPPRIRDLGRQDEIRQFSTEADVMDVDVAARELLRDKRWRLRDPAEDPADAAPQIAAEKGLWSREGGSLLFHTSFYVLLVAVVAGQLFGFRGQVGIVEGNSWAETPIGYWTSSPGRMWDDTDHTGFQLTLDEFEVDWLRDVRFLGQPSTFKSHVTITTADGETYQDVVAGNDPGVIDGMKVHQLDWGYAPRIVVEDENGEVVHDGFLTVSQNGPQGSWLGAVKAPSAQPDIGLEVLFWSNAPDITNEEGQPDVAFTGAPWADNPLVIFREFRGDLLLDRVQNVNTLDTTALESRGGGVMRLGDAVQMPDGVTVRFPELRRWVGFQVSTRPTDGLLLIGALLVLAGLLPALYAYRRRLWIEATPDRETGRTLVTVAGRAFQRPQAFTSEHDDLTEALRARLSGTMVSAPRDDQDDHVNAAEPLTGTSEDQDPT